MFNKGHSSNTLEEILESVSEAQLLAHYLGITKIPCLINSPLRKDKHPSFGIYTKDGKHVKYKDYATGEYGSSIHLLELLWGKNFIDTIKKINNDFFSIKHNKNVPTLKVTYATEKHTLLLQNLKVKVRKWEKWDEEYWEKYGVSLKVLQWADVYPISHVIFEKNGNRYIFPADKYAYVYVERKDGNISLKVYQPYSKAHKWMSKHDSSVWDLWTKLPQEGDKLIITSSRKDSLAIWENTHIPSVSLQGEGYIPKQHVVQELKNRFKKVYILYDNDFQAEENHGRLFGKKLAEMFGLIQIEIPDSYKSKDSSDLVMNYNRETLKQVIFNLISNF
jgi:hypothetical protein